MFVHTKCIENKASQYGKLKHVYSSKNKVKKKQVTVIVSHNNMDRTNLSTIKTIKSSKVVNSTAYPL